MKNTYMIASIFSLLAIAERPRAETVTARLEPRNWEAAVASLKDHATEITEVNPIWYQLVDGGVGSIPEAKVGDQKLLSIVSARNVHGPRPPKVAGEEPLPDPPKKMLLRPVVQAGSAGKFRREHVTALVRLAGADQANSSPDYDGIDLEFETLDVGDTNAFMTLIDDLAMSLRDSGKSLAVTCKIGTGNPPTELLTRIGSSVESLRLLSTGKAGDTAAEEDLVIGRHLKEITKAVPADKLIHAVPLKTREGKEGQNSIRARMELSRAAGIKNLSLTSLGSEDTNVWSLLKRSENKQ